MGDNTTFLCVFWLHRSQGCRVSISGLFDLITLNMYHIFRSAPGWCSRSLKSVTYPLLTCNFLLLIVTLPYDQLNLNLSELKRISIVGAPHLCFRFPTCRSISNAERARQMWLGSKIGAKFSTFSPTLCKSWEKWVKCLSEFFKFLTKTKPLMHFCRIARCAVWAMVF